ncbi:MAG: choice-of-anchor D domain-containing protein [bacterium]
MTIGVNMAMERKAVHFLSTVCVLLSFFVHEVEAQPDIAPSDTSHDFGSVGVGLSSDWDLILANRGDAALTISSVTPNLAEFTVSHPSFPRTVAPGGSLSVSVVFRPSGLGSFSGVVEVVSNDPDQGLLTLEVTGQGVAVVNITVPDTSVPAGDQLFLPITVDDDVSGMGITSVDLRLVFDRRVLSAHGASNVGTMAQLWDLQVDADQDQIEIRMSGLTPLAGSGILVYIDFSVSPEAPFGQSTPIVLAEVTFNGGVPVAIPHDGMFTVAVYSLSGRVTYYKHATPVEGVLLSLQGGSADSVWTDATGSYRFDDIPGGRDYTVTPSKHGQVRPAINSYDAALVLRYGVNLLSLDSLQLLAADVTGSGEVTAYDVSGILQFRVGKIDHFPIGKEWLLLPEVRDYYFLSSDLADQDYTALVYGDVSGNWPGAGAGKLPVPPVRPRVVLPDLLSAVPGETASIPVLLEEAEGVISADVQLGYDPQALDLVEVRTTSFTSDFVLQFHDRGGVVQVAMAGVKYLRGTGELLRLTFWVSSLADCDQGIPIEISATVNEDVVAADHLSGMLTLPRTTVPDGYGLEQNYPNPFNPATTIRFTIPSREQRTGSEEVRGTNLELGTLRTTLKIYNILGQEVRTLVDETTEAGYYSVVWDGRDEKGDELSSGVYYCQMMAGPFVSTKRMVLLR